MRIAQIAPNKSIPIYINSNKSNNYGADFSFWFHSTGCLVIVWMFSVTISTYFLDQHLSSYSFVVHVIDSFPDTFQTLSECFMTCWICQISNFYSVTSNRFRIPIQCNYERKKSGENRWNIDDHNSMWWWSKVVENFNHISTTY